MRKISAMRKIPAAWNVLALITGCLLLSSWTAHAAKELLAQQSIEIDASPKAVWGSLDVRTGDFTSRKGVIQVRKRCSARR